MKDFKIFVMVIFLFALNLYGSGGDDFHGLRNRYSKLSSSMQHKDALIVLDENADKIEEYNQQPQDFIRAKANAQSELSLMGVATSSVAIFGLVIVGLVVPLDKILKNDKNKDE